MHPPNRNSGFTLVEIMIVVTILAIIMSIGVPAYRSALRIARTTKAEQELRTISTAVDMFRASNDGNLPLTLYEVGYGGRLDPWGTPYCYLNNRRELATAWRGQSAPAWSIPAHSASLAVRVRRPAAVRHRVQRAAPVHREEAVQRVARVVRVVRLERALRVVPAHRVAQAHRVVPALREARVHRAARVPRAPRLPSTQSRKQRTLPLLPWANSSPR